MPDTPAFLASRPRHFGFLTLPSYSMIAFSHAVEALRVANYVDRTEHYRWTVFSIDGHPVEASNGIAMRPTHALDVSDSLPDVMIVCGGTRIREMVDARTRHALCALAKRRIVIGALCSGVYALLAAGLLDRYRCAAHWADLYALRAEFPDVEITDELFVTDRDRITCTGGIAPMDMMLTLMSSDFGPHLVVDVSKQLVVNRLRGVNESQPIPVCARLESMRGELVEAVKLMEANVEEPLSFRDIARLVGLSERQLQRVFKEYLSVSPRDYYRGVRLRHARDLLRRGNDYVSDVSARCGFPSACTFSKAYRKEFGHAPIVERRAPRCTVG
ncbi:GlxA family transcriptional regulator [Burkholderia multivorans]|uniref:Arginine pathway regulatory protein ArgR n=1 Tax=Burkholderia multivorans CGD2 TaxID=513052 RepID=B9BUR1_9BURK|nr:GlxA family transcriptional regulator [Burkholderia multivorans]EEE05558.1 arginine pathway regulatory protein ArgR [Burkholderia multivorans CGD2]EEE11830.1 arginine pathway regulatory protein ArgR [Burkholderia multivorans CGD2M]